MPTTQRNDGVTSLPIHKPDWYTESLEDAAGWKTIRELLINYSGIPEDEVAEHVYTIRDRAWNIFNYPCIGGFRFLDLSIGQSANYSEILQRVKDGQKLLDLGCCFGQDERRLVADGAPSENLYACDLRPEFTELGYDLFLDRSTLQTHFFSADIFDAHNTSLDELDGKVDIINASSFFHLFGYEDQRKVAVKVTQLLHRRAGSLVVGRQVGNVNAGVYPNKVKDSGTLFRHNVASWTDMWNDVGVEMGVKWKVEAELRTREEWLTKASPNGEGMKLMRFTITML